MEETQKIPIPFDELNIDQLRFMMEVCDPSLYFEWDPVENGLVHKLGVKKIKNKINPILPIIRCESMLIYEDCVFDDFSPFGISGARFNKCTFKSFKGFDQSFKDNYSLQSQTMPKTLWDSGGDFHYNWDSKGCIMPSTGTVFTNTELDPRISNKMYPLLKAFEGTRENDKIFRMCEQIWLMELKDSFPEVFIELMESLTSAHLDRALELIVMEEKNYQLYRRVNEKII